MERRDPREDVQTLTLEDRIVERLQRAGRCERWGVSTERFREALEASARKAGVPPRDVERKGERLAKDHDELPIFFVIATMLQSR